MDHFNYRHGELYAENVPLSRIAAEIGSPCYVYSRATLERHWHAFDKAMGTQPHLICYAVKANSNIAVLNILARLGSGFDIVSVGELERVLQAGGEPSKIVFSGVGKREDEIASALKAGIKCFNVESEAELQQIAQVARAVNTVANIALRVNPDIDPKTHPYISTGLKENKFGIPVDEALALFEWAHYHPNLAVKGVDCHIGSQLLELDPFLEALDRVMTLADALSDKQIMIDHIDLGGGLGAPYRHEEPPLPSEYAKALFARMHEAKRERYTLILEPGRAIAANAGILLTKVEYLKPTTDKHFAIVDAAMNDLLRPALYGAWQEVVTIKEHSDSTSHMYDVVGPVCETGDFLAKDRLLALRQGDLLAVRSAGAYGFVMSSNYNSRPRPPEVMVDRDKYYIVRERETLADLVRHEHLIPLDD